MIINAPITTLSPILQPCPKMVCGLVGRILAVSFATSALVLTLMEIITIEKTCRNIDDISLQKIDGAVSLIFWTSVPLIALAIASNRIAMKYLSLPKTYYTNLFILGATATIGLTNLCSSVVFQHYPCGIVRTISQNFTILGITAAASFGLCLVQAWILGGQNPKIRARSEGSLVVLEDVSF